MLLVLGDSHGWALGRSLRGLEPAVLEPLKARHRHIRAGPMQQARFFVRPFHHRDGDRLVLTDKAAEGFRRISRLGRDWIGPEDGRHRFGLCFGLNPQRFIASSTWAEHAVIPVPGKGFVSHAVFDALRRHHQRYILDFWRDLGEIGAKAFIIDAPPPPLRMLAGQPHASRREIEAVIAAFNAGMLADAARLGIPVLPHPPEARDNDGTFRPELTLDGDDNNHGNATYGAMVWKTIAENPAL